MTHIADVLVLRALGIGDLLVAVPVLRGLRRAFPDARLVLAAPAWLAPLVDLTGCVDVLLPTPGLGALRWREPGPLVAVNLHGAGPESTVDLMMTRPTRLMTHRHDAFPEVPGPGWHDDQHEAVRWCRLLEWHGIAAEPTDLDLLRPVVATTRRGAVVVHPGASVPARRWAPARFADVARQLSAAGRHVVVTGSAEEHGLAAAVAAGAGLPGAAVVAGRLDLTGLAALIADATLVVSNDTGVGHLATAYRTPSVVLFGPTPPARWGPPAHRREHAALWAGPRGVLHQITTEDVLAAADVVLDREHRPAAPRTSDAAT